MTRRCSRLKVRLGALSVIASLLATQAGAQATESGVPTAQDIWRHLPPLPGQASKPAPMPVPPPTSKPTPPASAASRLSAPPRRAPAGAVRQTASEAVLPRTLAQARVVIHFAESGGYDRSEELARLLRAVGTAEVETRSVRHPVDRQSVRYFHAADRDVSGLIGDMVGGGGRATVSDFTSFRPSPRNGTIEIWLP